jgi:hypothetical protein
MSKKGKLILATALFGASLFGASCGGGGGTASTPPPPPPPPATPVAKSVVQAPKGIIRPGATVGVFEGTVKSDGTVSWSSDKLPGENLLQAHLSNGSIWRIPIWRLLWRRRRRRNSICTTIPTIPTSKRCS